jgi:D-alanyl-D-alanine carboxypeptidase
MTEDDTPASLVTEVALSTTEDAEEVSRAAPATRLQIAVPAHETHADDPPEDPVLQVVERKRDTGGARWSITVGRYPSQYKARKVLLQVALNEMATLDGSTRKVLKRQGGFDANFQGLSRETAELACRRLAAKKITCFMIEPAG